jgi:hypothetical protein
MLRPFSGKALAAVAGAVLLAQSVAAPASAFTLSSPSMSEHFSAGQVDKVYWCRWGRCGWGGGWGYHRWGWGGGWGWRRPGWGWGWGPRRHCWMGPWGWRCGWW